MVKAILFDLDGTLLDTSRDICAVIGESLTANGLKPLTLEQTVRFVGNGAKVLAERAVKAQGADSGLIEKVYNDFSKAYALCANDKTCLYKGEDQALSAFERAGIKLAIVTNKPQAATDNVVEKLLSAYGFAYVLGQGSLPLKPDPTGANFVMKTLGVTPEECVFVGDGEPDIQTAKNAKIRCVSVLWGFRTRKILQEAGGVCFAENYDELKNIILHL